MPEEKSNFAEKGKVIKKITLPDGFRVGLVNLDDIFLEVSVLKLEDPKIIKEELLKRAEINNYIPSGARTEYAAALLQEYRIKYGPPEAAGSESKPRAHKHTKG